MYAALVADSCWMADELAMFNRLVVGLMDEQVRVAGVMPACNGSEGANTFCQRLPWRDSDFKWLRRRRLLALAPQLASMQVDVLHALDGRIWHGTLLLAAYLGVGVVLNVSCQHDVKRARRLGRQVGGCRAVFAATTEPLAEAMREKAPDPQQVHVVWPGAHGVSGPPPTERDGALCLVITGDGSFDGEFQVFFAALGELIEHHPETLLFFDCQGGEQRPLWQAVRRQGLLRYSSMIPGHVSHREMLMGASMLIQPQSLGRARSLTLQAMACGVPVLAKQDPWLDYLKDGKTAWVVDSEDPEQWSALLKRVADDTEAAARLGDSARRWAARYRQPAQQIERTIDLYRRLSGESYKLDDAG